MNVTLYGAAGEVTGSAYLVSCGESRVLVDFGMFQGSQEQIERNYPPANVDLTGVLDAVVVTHAHLDHIGRLPLLPKLGHDKPIYATDAVIDLVDLSLKDAGRIQESDAERENRYRRREGLEPVEPLYDLHDVDQTLKLLRVAPYETPFEVAPGITVRMKEAGHSLGSVSVELTLEEDGRRKTIVFSGDLGRDGMPILRDFEPFHHADMVFLESTYGNREHKSATVTNEEARAILRAAYEQGGKILVPAFAVGRSQEVLYSVSGAFRNGVVPRFPVFLDSPMAIEATRIYADHPELMDEEATRLLEEGVLASDLAFIQPCPTAKESIALRNMEGPMMIVATSGMCTGGRILHHLRNHLPEPETAVVFVGYQAQNTLGRRLVEGEKRVKIFGDWVDVNATIYTLGGFSGHAGASGLLRWLEPLVPSRPRVVLTHGEDDGRHALASRIEEMYALTVEMPYFGDTLEL